MSSQTIVSQDITVGELFKDFYTVPDYQREYVWSDEQVEQLLEDVLAEKSDGTSPEKAAEYFIGSIVVCPGEGGVWELIDGQQRVTTLFILLCAIRDHLKASGLTPPPPLTAQIADSSVDILGQATDRYRLDLQYEDSGDVLAQIADAKPVSTKPADLTRSMANIINSYRVARTFLQRESTTNPDAAKHFYGYLVNKVKLIRIRTEDVAKALKVFETINDRGVGLDSMDLLKNLLFMHANREAFEKLKDTWKHLQDILYRAGEKPLRFLRYFILSSYDVEILREDEIYAWLRKNASLCGYKERPVEFAGTLVTAAKAYGNFLRGEDVHGKKDPYLQSLRLLGGSSARQHLVLLLSGRHLEPQLFHRLAREVESLFFCYVITREPTRDFERNFAQWAMELRKCKTLEDIESLVAKRFGPAKAGLRPRFEDALLRLSADSLQQYRLKYLLAKLTQHVEQMAYGETEGNKWLASFVDPSIEIEHILPQNASAAARAEFADSNWLSYVQLLGNLALVEKPINASLGNRPYNEKKGVYPSSQFLLTRAVSKLPEVGSKTKINAAVAALHAFSSWSPKSIEDRQKDLKALAMEVWQVPSQSPSQP